jgi:hypothetical protein
MLAPRCGAWHPVGGLDACPSLSWARAAGQLAGQQALSRRHFFCPKFSANLASHKQNSGLPPLPQAPSVRLLFRVHRSARGANPTTQTSRVASSFGAQVFSAGSALSVRYSLLPLMRSILADATLRPTIRSLPPPTRARYFTKCAPTPQLAH